MSRNGTARIDDALVDRMKALQTEYKQLFGEKASMIMISRIFAENAVLDKEMMIKIYAEMGNGHKKR